MRILFLVLVYCLPSLAFATKRLAVLEFRGVGVEDAVLMILSDAVRTGVLDVTQGKKIAGDDLVVMTRENTMDMLNQMGKSAEDCQGECEVELARNIGADFVISGEVAKLDELYVFTIKLHETDRGVLLASQILKETGMSALIDGAQRNAVTISKKGLKVGGASQGSIKEETVQSGQTQGGSSGWSVEDEGEEVVVKFTSEPTGASVYLDGEFLCSQTPCSKYLKSGFFDATFKKQRYADAQIDFTASEGKRVSATLSPLFGTVSVRSNVSGLDVQVAAERWGTIPFEKEIDPGVYTLSVSDSCYEPAAYRLQMSSGASEEVNIELSERKAGLKVYAFSGEEAVSGKVYVDGAYVGTTAKGLTLPLCSKSVEVKTESGSWSGELSLKERELVTIEAKMGGKGSVASGKSIEVRGHSMMLIPAGSFQMGCTKGDSDCYDWEKPTYSVEISRPFYMSQTEVTQGLWKEVMGSNPSCDDCPVENVSWYDAIAFLNKLSALEGLEQCYTGSGSSTRFKGLDCEGYRLPTEAEWEYAARGGEEYIYAGSSDIGSVAWYSGNSGMKTHPVCEKKENGYGLCDMSGNVWEWVWDWYGDYPSSKQVDPKGPKTGSRRVSRGGSWSSVARYARVSNRNYFAPSLRYHYLGFRFSRSSL